MLYLDHNASSPIRPVALSALTEAFELAGGNPNSSHSRGRAARQLLEEARRTIARLLGARPSEIFFTSGGTESNNLAMIGLYRSRSPRRRVVTVATEHPSVLRTAEALAEQGAEVVVLGVDGSGHLDPEAFSDAVTPNTALCSVMLANNETGVLHDVAAVAAVCASRDVPLHCDAVQGVGKVPVELPALGAATVSFTAHKLGGPIGIGALYARKGERLGPLIRGGGQERGLRPGTQPYALVHSFSAALAQAVSELALMAGAVRSRRDELEAQLRARFPELIVWGVGGPRLPNTTFVALSGHDAAEILLGLDELGIQVGTGAACGAHDRTPSPVLTAMGASPSAAQSTLRFSLATSTPPQVVPSTLAALDTLVC